MTLLKHYYEIDERNHAPTDLALRYSIPFSRVGVMFAGDATNVFDEDVVTPREWRLWVRLRM